MAEVAGQDVLGVHAEDRVLIEKLATLQSMYNQVSALRTLLPDKLINPMRSALQNPTRCNPEKLAVHLKDAAISGSRDIAKFKKYYHGEDLRGVWQPASAAEFPQGQDGWVEDYISLAREFKGLDKEAKIDAAHTAKQEDGDAKSISDILTAIREAHPGMTLTITNEATGFPIDVSFSELKLRVQERTDDRAGYKVTSNPENNPNQMTEDILRNIESMNNELELDALLELISSYESIKSQPCDKCQKVFDNQLQLPLARRPANQKFIKGGATWVKLHENCA